MPLVREAVPDDASVLARFAETTFRDTFASVNTEQDMDSYCEQSFGRDIQAAEITQKGHRTLLCEEGSELLGFAQLRRERAPDCIASARPMELQRLYIAADWHGRGVAQQLMEAALAIAIDSGCDTLWLGVWEDNPRAIAFYNKYGFQAVGEHSFRLGEDLQRDIVMRCPLPTE